MQITGHRKNVNKDMILQLTYQELTSSITYAFYDVVYCISDIEPRREEQH
jgi:SHS2 domain-containing protein